MKFTKKMMNIMFLVMMFCGKTNGETYKVGDSAGWTNTGSFDYKIWAAIKNFHVGDNILFEYNKEYHNVVRVTHENFNSCNATAPYGTMKSGHDMFTIKRPGHFYFICGVPGHCQAGQKVDIRVLAAPDASPIAPSSPPQFAPAPSPKSSASISSPVGFLKSSFGLSIFVVASIAFGIGC